MKLCKREGCGQPVDGEDRRRKYHSDECRILERNSRRHVPEVRERRAAPADERFTRRIEGVIVRFPTQEAAESAAPIRVYRYGLTYNESTGKFDATVNGFLVSFDTLESGIEQLEIHREDRARHARAARGRGSRCKDPFEADANRRKLSRYALKDAREARMRLATEGVG
jgi:hypothetical protein